MKIFYFIIMGWSYVCFSGSVASADSTAWRLVQQGKTQLAANKLKEAEQSFRQALQKDRQLTAAMAGLGEVFLAKKDWGEANDWYDKILDREPENLEAMYYRGICYRECGVPKAMILRKLDWDNAAKHFKKVLARDSTFYDTLFQYAKLRRYQEHYAEAIELGHRQVRLRPEQVESQRGLFRLYQHFLDNKGSSEALKWLRENDSEHARFFIGEVYRRDKKLALLADSTFQQLLTAAPTVSLIPLHLALTRLYYQQNNNNEAEQNFWRAVDGIRNRLDAELVFEEVKYLVSAAELQQFRQLTEAPALSDFFHKFWISRDPTPAAPNNARLAEHYRRLQIVEKDYVYDGFRTWFNNPDKLGYQKFPPTFYLNDRFNDRGLIFIRQGDPDERLVTTTLAVESWLYKPRVNTPEMIFHFVVDENGVGNNWRLTPFIDNPQFWDDRVNFGNAYSRMTFGDPMERMALTEEIGQQSRAAVDTGFRFDRHTWNKNVQPLNATAYAAFFKGPDSKSYFDLYYSLPLPSVNELARAGNDNPTLCEHGVTLHDLEWRRVEQRHDQITKEQIPDLASMPSLIGQYHLAVQPDSYHVAFFVRQPATNRLGGWKDELRIPRFDEGTLTMSSLVLASSITPSSDDGLFTKNGLRIIPVPAKHFARNQPVYVYFEVYNLIPDAAGKSSFVVEYTTLLRKEKKSGTKKVFSILGSKTKPSTTLAMEREAEGTTSTEYLALDLNKAGAGDFRLSVRVKDKKSGRESGGFIDLTLVDMKNKK